MADGQDEDERLRELLKPPAFLDGPLIDATGEWNEVADLDFGGNYHYSEGYRLAAEAVIQAAGDSEHDADRFIYPVVFLYRHRIELALKELLAYGPDVVETHDLETIWKAARAILEREISVPDGQLSIVESRIIELHTLDKTATAFRYAYKKQKDGGVRSVSGAINMKLFAKRAESLCDTLEGWDIAIYETRNARAEMEDEMRAQYEDEYYDQFDESG